MAIYKASQNLALRFLSSIFCVFDRNCRRPIDAVAQPPPEKRENAQPGFDWLYKWPFYGEISHWIFFKILFSCSAWLGDYANMRKIFFKTPGLPQS